MPEKGIHAVTGAFGFSGKYITRRLLDAGCEVRALTNSPQRKNPFGGRVKAYPYGFDNPDELAESLDGVSVLFNNYWVRFNWKANAGGFSYCQAVENTYKLFEAASRAGVEKIVHISITNPSEDSPFEYFRGKAKLERALMETGIPYSVLRPAVLFGAEDILINNIAWFLRRFPVFGVFGDGQYRLQPIYVDDLAELAVREAALDGDHIINAIGPETFMYRGLAEVIGRIIGKPRPVISLPPILGFAVGALIGKIMGDVVITRDEIGGLMAGLLYTDSAPTGNTKLTDWAMAHSDTIGTHYASELARRKNRVSEYEKL